MSIEAGGSAAALESTAPQEDAEPIVLVPGAAAEKAASPGDDWRSEALEDDEEAQENPVAVARERAHEPGRGREAISPTEIPARGWRDILWRVLYCIPQDRVLSTAGSVAFFTLLAFFPAVATVVSIYGLVADTSAIGTHLSLLAGILPGDALTLIGDQMTRVAGTSKDTLGIAFLVGLLIAMWSANSGVAALFDALNVVYKEREGRSLLRFYGTTFLFTLGAVAFVLCAIGGVVVLPLVLTFVGVSTSAERLLSLLRWPVLLVVVVLALALVYRYGPSRRDAKWRWVTPGSVAAAMLWIATSMLFSWYVSSFDSYNRTYGSLGAGIGFMTWIWLSVAVVLIGAELNAEMEHQTARDTTRGGREKPLGRRGAVMADRVGPAQD